jgi:hypothetical protein
VTVKLLGGRRRGIDGGRAAPWPLEFPVSLLELLAELAHLFLQLVRALKATENLEAIRLNERDRNLLVGCESEAEVAISHDALGRRVNGWLDFVLPTDAREHVRAVALVRATQLSEQLRLR